MIESCGECWSEGGEVVVDQGCECVRGDERGGAEEDLDGAEDVVAACFE